MVLVDTSVWVRHFRVGEAGLGELLRNGSVVTHPFVIGELACGNLRNRAEILSLLRALPAAVQADHEEVLQFIESKKLMGRGIGYIDAHLLASAFLSGVRIWTLDKKLKQASSMLKVGV